MDDFIVDQINLLTNCEDSGLKNLLEKEIDFRNLRRRVMIAQFANTPEAVLDVCLELNEAVHKIIKLAKERGLTLLLQTPEFSLEYLSRRYRDSSQTEKEFSLTIFVLQAVIHYLYLRAATIMKERSENESQQSSRAVF